MRNHATAARLFLAFTFHFALHDFPASPSNLILFAQFLARQFRSPASVINTVYALKTVHSRLGFSTAAFSHFQVRSFLKALQSSYRHFPVKKLPLSLPLLHRIVSVSSLPPSLAPLFLALLTLLFHTLLRLSSVLPASQNLFDPTRHLTLGDLFPYRGGFAVLVKWTKSRQLAHQAYVVPLGRVVGSSLCPVLALRKLVDSYASSQPHQPLFSLPGSPFSPLSAPVARSWLRQALAAADLDPTLYSFHSLRRGGAAAAHAAGHPLQDVQCQGGWASSAVLSYLPGLRVRRSVAASLASFHPSNP